MRNLLIEREKIWEINRRLISLLTFANTATNEAAMAPVTTEAAIKVKIWR